MDDASVDICMMLPGKYLSLSDNTMSLVTNGWMLEGVQRYPDRLIMCPNYGPVIKRGVKKAIWEMEYFAKEHGVKSFKFYPPEDTYINDRELWPFYEKAMELGQVMQVHTGTGWVYGQINKYCHPALLEDVLYDFYDLKIVAFHFGWPHHRELNHLMATFPNLHTSVSFLQHWINSRPRLWEELIGEAMLWAGSDRIVWGTDGMGPFKGSVEAFKNFQMPEEAQRGYGFLPVTDEDKAKIFGLNMARLLGIDPTKRTKGVSN